MLSTLSVLYTSLPSLRPIRQHHDSAAARLPRRAMKGAASSRNYEVSSTIALLPGDSSRGSRVSPHASLLLPTGLTHTQRNGVVARADAVVAIGGGAGGSVATAACRGWAGILHVCPYC